jgi:hypothetical protein
MQVTKDELYAHPGWNSCTFEGAREELLLLGLRTTFREKLEWLEEAETLSLHLRARRAVATAEAGESRGEIERQHATHVGRSE